jgi:predicted nucleic acid-binding protein
MRVVADTSPINYLVLIGEVDLLHRLYDVVVIPLPVRDELLSPRAPEPVRNWVETAPPWLLVHLYSPELVPDPWTILPELRPLAANLDRGERDALELARILRADLVVIDDRTGRQEARRLNLDVTGTLGVLSAAADRGFIDREQALERLERTSFYISPGLRARFLRGE